MATFAIVSLTVGAGATASVATGTLSIKVLRAHIERPAPPECDGMAFVRTIVGTTRNDVIRLTHVPTLVFGLGGRDVILGGNAPDCLVGGDGADFVAGGGNGDVVVGGNGDDRLGGGRGSDRIYGGPGKDRLFDAELARDDDEHERTTDRATAWSERERGPGKNKRFESDISPDLMDGGAQRDRCFGSRLDTFNACEWIFLGRPDDEDEVSLDQFDRREPRTRHDPTPTPTAGEPGTDPSSEPTVPMPTADPTVAPTPDATAAPTPNATPGPTPAPTPDPTPDPTPHPTADATPDLTPEPTPDPTADLTPDPTDAPS